MHHHAYNAAVQRPRNHVSSPPHVHNEMAHLRRGTAWVHGPLQLLVMRHLHTQM
jgi:hypothetical protein